MHIRIPNLAGGQGRKVVNFLFMGLQQTAGKLFDNIQNRLKIALT